MNPVRSIDAGGIHRHFCIILLLDGCCQEGCRMKQNHNQSRIPSSRRQSAMAGSSILYYRSIFIRLHFWCCLWFKKKKQQQQGSAIWDHTAIWISSDEHFIYKLTLLKGNGSYCAQSKMELLCPVHWLLGLNALWFKCSSLSH